MRGNEKVQMVREIVSRRAPQLAGLLPLVGDAPLTEEQCQQLREVLAAELCEHGLGEGDSPNQYGRVVDGLIGFLGEGLQTGSE